MFEKVTSHTLYLGIQINSTFWGQGVVGRYCDKHVCLPNYI